MFELIKRLVFAYKVCHKYGIVFYPYRGHQRSPASYEIDLSTDKSKIWCCLLQERFYESLFHEIGHVLDFKRNRYSRGKYSLWDGAYLSKGKVCFTLEPTLTLPIEESSRMFCKRVVSEVVASRTALRMLKSCGKLTDKSLEDLVYSLQTYLKYIDKTQVAHYTYNLTRVLKGETNVKF
jgi:hypothetical protein